MAIELVVMSLGRFISGDFVSPSMRRCWDQGLPYTWTSDEGPQERRRGTPWGGPAAPRRRQELLGPINDWLHNLPAPIPAQLWDEDSLEAPRFFRVDTRAFRALQRQARSKRALHVGSSLLLPCAFEAPIEMTAPLKRRTGSLAEAEQELTRATWSGDALPAHLTLLAAVRAALTAKLPLLVRELDEPEPAPEVQSVIIDAAALARVKGAWGRIEGWLALHAAPMLAELRPPATPRQIAEAETALGVQLPDEVRALYCLHDGNGRNGLGLLGGQSWLSLASVVSEWRVWQQLLEGNTFEGAASAPDHGVSADWWNPGWIPLTYNGAGDHHCVDLAPVAGGSRGQIIQMWHDSDHRPRVALGLCAWLERLADELESGARVYSEDAGALLLVDEM